MSQQLKEHYQIIGHTLTPVIIDGNDLEAYTIHTYRDVDDEDATAVATLEEVVANEVDEDSQESYHTEEYILPSNEVDVTLEETVSGYQIVHHNELATELTPVVAKSKNFFCPNCGNCYSAAGSLKLHIRACTKAKNDEAPDDRTCDICNKVFNSVSYLKEHLLRHTGQGPKKCPKCYRKFFDDSKYEAHVASHKNEVILDDEAGPSGEKKVAKQFQCSFCSKQFTVVFDSRSCKRRYACDDCREKYSNEEMLKQHKASLEEKKDFRCEKCSRKFVFEGFLQRHLETCDGTIKRKRDRVL